METDSLQERQRFIEAWQTGHWSMSELCERFGISRPTGYKWRDRAAHGFSLLDRSHAPHHCPHRVPAPVAALLIAARREYGWGARKLVAVLARRHPTIQWPAVSTVNDVFARQHLLRRRRRRSPPWVSPHARPLATTHPNHVWPADFKGQFKTGDGRYCYPLTVTDHFSRALLTCRGLASTRSADTQAAFRALFREAGLPDAIRTDNGAPFASPAVHGLSVLNVWWMQLGIVHQRIPPASPQCNGTHERMHRELKRETTRPAAATRRAQQQRFDAFRTRYNQERPHEALQDRTPASVWTPSPRPYPERCPRPDYPGTMEVRRVATNGTFSWHGRFIFVSETLATQDVGLEEVADDVWNVVFYRTLLGRLDGRSGKISGA